MPAKLLENIRPLVIAGFAKLAELVKKYAAPMYRRLPRRLTRRVGAGQREDDEHQSERRDDLGDEMAAGDAVVGGDAQRCVSVHDVGRDRAGGAAGDLRGKVGGGGPPTKAAERGVDERDDRVEVGSRDGAEDEDDRVQAGGRRRRVLEQLEADAPR